MGMRILFSYDFSVLSLKLKREIGSSKIISPLSIMHRANKILKIENLNTLTLVN